MKAIVLAGGFAKRLWPLTLEQAKPLVDINGRPIISFILDKLDNSPAIKEIIISTNAKFHNNFKSFLESQTFKKPVKLVVEKTLHEGEKLGAVGGLNYVIQKENLKGPLLVIGGDNLIGVDLNAMLKKFETHKKPIIAAYDMKSLDEVRSKFGEVIIDKNSHVRKMNEKPENPVSTLISTCCYAFPAGVERKVQEYIDAGHNKDAPGFFISWLAQEGDVLAHVFDEYWFDIGDHDTLKKAREFAEKNLD
jgi:glucose-1-phosphate thymidylyltransferase